MIHHPVNCKLLLILLLLILILSSLTSLSSSPLLLFFIVIIININIVIIFTLLLFISTCDPIQIHLHCSLRCLIMASHIEKKLVSSKNSDLQTVADRPTVAYSKYLTTDWLLDESNWSFYIIKFKGNTTFLPRSFLHQLSLYQAFMHRAFPNRAFSYHVSKIYLYVNRKYSLANTQKFTIPVSSQWEQS